MTLLRKIRVSQRALSQIEEAAEWWALNRPSAPNAIHQDVAEMLDVLLDLRLTELDWRSRHPNLVAFAERIFARPSFAATIPEAQQITEVQ